MRTARATTTAVLLLALFTAAVAHGCGGSSPGLTFSSDRDTPVIAYSSYQAIAPVYNPGVPVTVVYPELVIRKNGPYDLKSAMLTRGQVSDMLEKLDELGFFRLKKEYRGAEPLAGGTTEKLSVELTSGTYAVSVEGGAGPPDWGDIVATVTNAKASGFREYVPLSLMLHASEAGEEGAGADVKPWPGDPADLGKAAAAPGFRLEGDRAATAWKAISASFSQGGSGEDTYWGAGGKVYRYVYATPLLPGIETGS